MTQTTFNPNTEAPKPAPSDQKRVYVIFNPVSGKSDPEERKKIISDALTTHGYTCQFIATTRQQDAKACAEEALAQGADLLAVSGGDGTVMEAMSALVGKDTPIAVFPAGTGNLLSINLGIPMTVPDAIDVALGGQKYALDLARTGDGRYFAIMGGLGMDAQMIKDSGREAKKKLGKLAYFVAALKNLPRRRARVEIILDDRPPIQRRVKSVLLGRAQQDRSLEVYQARKITLRPRRPQPVEFDGEDGGTTRELTVEIVPQAVQVLIPENAPGARDAQELPPAVVAERTAKRRLLVPLALLLLLLGAAWAWRRRRL